MGMTEYAPSSYILGNYSLHPDTGCWIWSGSVDSWGYGVISAPNGKKLVAHRVFYKHFCGPIPDGMFVLHGCDTPRCVNPEHLEAGTQKKNMQDMHARGRAAKHEGKRRGSGNPSAKLTEAEVVAIKTMLSSRQKTRLQIASEYGVSIATIGMIAANLRWSHVHV